MEENSPYRKPNAEMNPKCALLEDALQLCSRVAHLTRAKAIGGRREVQLFIRLPDSVSPEFDGAVIGMSPRTETTNMTSYEAPVCPLTWECQKSCCR